MKVHCIYHRTDFDGIGSAAVISYFHKNDDIILHPFNYSDPIPHFKKWNKNDKVYLVDLSFDKIEDVATIATKFGDNFIWIDHHASGIEAEQKNNLTHIKGIRKEGLAAIQLTWKYLFPKKKEPLTIKHIGAMDIWKLSTAAEQFETGIEGHENLYNPKDLMWEKLFKDNKTTVQKIKTVGKIIHNYKMKDLKDYSEFIHLVNYHGTIVPAVNRGQTGSIIFERNIKDLYKKYKFVIVYYRRKDAWKFSCYTNREDIDVRNYSKKEKGKGHRKACGFIWPTLPFTFVK